MNHEHPRERYWRTLLGVAPRLLSLLDRESRSPTRGSFDRVHWGWKFRDFPLTMWQASVMPLAILWRHPHEQNRYFQEPQLADWLCAAITNTLDRQHRNGAFDSFTPYSQDHGVTLAMVLSLSTSAELLHSVVAPSLRERLLESIARACAFAQRSDEDYAFISNHQSAFVLAYLRAARLTGDAALIRRADAVIDAVLSHQSADGWFAEYGGPDPGYETFGLTYLALAQREHPRPAFASALARSVEFLAHCVHPDGSVGGNYGSRNTGQFAPGGLELLVPELPMAGAIADFVSQRAERGNVVTPLSCDDDNLPLLTFSYAVAAVEAVPRRSANPPLPCERRDVLTRFDDSKVVVAATQRYFAVTNLAKGGVMRIFDRATESLAYEDAGYVLVGDGREWSTQLLGESVVPAESTTATLRTTARFSALRREVVTPAKFLIIRVLNLTVFRSVLLGALVRRMIIARLITGREGGRWSLRREIAFEPERVVVSDAVSGGSGGGVTFVSLERSLLPIHMGSAKYFHANELAPVARPSLDGWVATVNAGETASLSQVIGFESGEVTYRHDAGDDTSRESAVNSERHTA